MKRTVGVLFRETLRKVFPAPDLRCEAAFSTANPCASAGGSKEAVIHQRFLRKCFAICCILAVLCACGRKTPMQENDTGGDIGRSGDTKSVFAENGTEKKQKSSMDKESREESAPIQGREQPAVRDLSDLEAWKIAYLAYLDELESKNFCTYTFLYVDDDDIPELVIDSGYEAGGCLILTWHDGVLDELQTWRLNFSYIEKGNLLCNSDGNMGYYYDKVSVISDKKWEYVAEGEYVEKYDEENGGMQLDENGDMIFEYSWNGEAVDEAEYTERLNAVYPAEKAVNPSYEAKYYILSEIRSILETGDVTSAGHRYELILEDVTWKDAEALCKEKGGYLATVTSWEEYERIQEQIIAEEKTDISFWVGAACERAGGFGFRWLEPGTENGYSMLELYNALFVFWLEGEPSYRGFTEDGVEVEEGYVILSYRNGDNKCYLLDMPNDILSAFPSYEGKIGFICEYN